MKINMVLEGLQTHRDYYNQSYATKLIKFMIRDLSKDGVEVIYSEVRIWNKASNKLHQKLGFTKYAEAGYNNLYKLNIKQDKKG